MRKSRISFRELKKAREETTAGYKQGQFVSTPASREAYVATRMPATFSVVKRLLQQIQPVKTLLDLGAGPATVYFAAREVFPDISVTLFEKDKGFIESNPDLHWIQGDLEKNPTLPPHDLVTLSYCIGELKNIKPLIENVWKAALQYVVVVEPGTPAGFERIKAVRAQLISLGAHIVAPCPHAGACPNSWCHFSTRVARSSLHRQLKGGTLGYEDEKFSYVIAAKNPHPLPEARILRHPMKHSGHIKVSVCTKEGLQEKSFSKKLGPLYKLARKWEWGDSF